MRRFLSILFGDDAAVSAPAARHDDAHVAAAALMVEAARLDGSFTDVASYLSPAGRLLLGEDAGSGTADAIPAMTGDVKADMDAIRAFYAGINAKGLVPENVGPIALRDEK